MELSSDKFEFTREMICGLSLGFKGIYVLYNSCKEIIYIGVSDENIEKSLLEQLNRSYYKYTDVPAYFSVQSETSPESKVSALLSTYREVFGRLPKLNDIINITESDLDF